MFGSLKKKISDMADKIKSSVSINNGSAKTAEPPKAEVETKAPAVEEAVERTSMEKIPEKVPETVIEPVPEKILEKKVGISTKAKAFFKGEFVLDEKKLGEILGDFEIALLESDVAFDVTEKIISDLKTAFYGKHFKRGSNIEDIISDSLEKSLKEIIVDSEKTLVEIVRDSPVKPYIIAFVGINGTGKTTTIAKVAHIFKKQGVDPVIAASDTYRAGAIEQVEKHAERLGIRLIKHEKGGDPAAVAFDAIKHAQSKGKDVVLIDTAGRMETNKNLLDEMKKIVRVAKPHMIIFVGDAITGNSAVDQAENFNKAVEIGGIILTKVDADSKGGTAISVAHTIKKPIFYVGVGQEYDDLVDFNTDWLIREIMG